MIDDIMLEAEEKMEKAVEVAKEDFAAIRTGRANPALFQKIMVEYYGAPTPLQQLASIQVPEARMVLITPFDKSATKDVERALRQSSLGLNPSEDGGVLRINLPELTEDRRKEYIKIARDKGEHGKVSMRNVRRHAKDQIDKLVKDGEIGEDEGTRAEKDLDALTKRYTDQVDALLKGKESELLAV